MTTRTKQASALDAIDSLLLEINGRGKRAESHTEAGGYDGPTTHQIKDVDDHAEDAEEGARSAENEADVKEDQGAPAVDNAKEAAGDQDSVQLNIGTHQSATGEDASIETASAKGGKDDEAYAEETTHPARTDNDELDGHKYASSIGKFRDLVKSAAALGDQALSVLVVDQYEQNAPSGQQAAAKQAGADLADAVAPSGQVEGFDKIAQAQQVVGDVAETVLFAYRLADKTASYLNAYDQAVAQAQKAANEDPFDAPASEAGEEESSEDGIGGGDVGGEAAPEEAAPGLAGGPEGGGGEIDPQLVEALLQALLAGEGGGGEIPGEVPGAEAALGGMGGDPLEGAGDPAMGGDPGMGGGGDEEAMLEAALAEAGVSPEALEAAAASKAAAELRRKQAGTKQAWRPKTAGQKARFDNMVSYIKEVCGR